MAKLLTIMILLTAFLVGCHRLTANQEDGIKQGAGVLGSLFGIPAPIVITVAGAILGLTHHQAYKHGRRTESKKQKAQVA